MANPTERNVVLQRRSTFLPVFPLELWDMIIERLFDDESAQHLSRLAQTCSMLYLRIESRLYNPVRLSNSESGARLALTIEKRPELAPLIREIRHKGDNGFEMYSGRHFKFYQMAATLPYLEKLVMKRNPRPLDLKRWASKHQRDEAMMGLMKQMVSDSLSTKEWRELGFGPPGESSFSPPDAKLTFNREGTKETLFWHALLQDPPGMPALRVCHIGSDYDHNENDSKMDRNGAPKFNTALFRHPGLLKLCITGAIFAPAYRNFPPLPIAETPLEELTLLNCIIDPSDLEGALEYPRALKRFTFRGPISEDMMSPEGSLPDYAAWIHKQTDSLEYMDYDLYWGGDDEADFADLVHLKHLTTTLSTLAGRECLELEPETFMPPGLESLTIRYDEVKAWLPSSIYEMVKSEALPNLRHLTCEIPEIIDNLPSINESKKNPPATQICQEINTWKSRFEKLNVELSAVIVPYPLELSKYNECSCECLSYYHRMPYHWRKPLTVPWEENGEDDVFFDDWADIDDELELDELMDDFAEEFGPDFLT